VRERRRQVKREEQRLLDEGAGQVVEEVLVFVEPHDRVHDAEAFV